MEIVPTSFEAWPAPPQAFDLVLSAQAFHWIEPELGCAKVGVDASTRRRARAGLVPRRLAGHGVLEGDAPLYDGCFPLAPPGERPRSLGENVREYRNVLGRGGPFADLRKIRHAWAKTYPGPDYLKLLQTFSDHRSLPEPAKTRFFEGIAAVIDHLGGLVHRQYETVLVLARTR